MVNSSCPWTCYTYTYMLAFCYQRTFCQGLHLYSCDFMSCTCSRYSGFITFVNFWHTFYSCHVWLVNLLYNASHDGYMNLFIIAMWVAILLSCSRLYVVNSRILSNEIIFKGSCPLVVCANMGLVLCPIPLDNCMINPFKILFKYFLRYFINLLILYSFGVVLVWVIVDIY